MLSTQGTRLHQAFLEIADGGASDHFKPWTYHAPLVISAETNRRLHRVQYLMAKCIRHFVEQYDAYRALMPVSEQVSAILSLCQHKPYRMGTYRTDFLIDEHNCIKLIEITCRFALNGFFISGFISRLMERFLADNPQVSAIDDYSLFFDRIMQYFGEFDHVCILKGADNRNETKYLIAIFEQAGFPVHVIPVDAITENLSLFNHAAVIGELDHMELFSLPLETIAAMIDAHLLNDLRTVLLIHDKRFFAVLHQEAFLRRHSVTRKSRNFAPI